jgi:hypothetical protein
MPVEVEEFVEDRLSEQDFYPDLSEDERRSIAYGIAWKQYKSKHPGWKPKTKRKKKSESAISLLRMASRLDAAGLWRDSEAIDAWVTRHSRDLSEAPVNHPYVEEIANYGIPAEQVSYGGPNHYYMLPDGRIIQVDMHANAARALLPEEGASATDEQIKQLLMQRSNVARVATNPEHFMWEMHAPPTGEQLERLADLYFQAKGMGVQTFWDYQHPNREKQAGHSYGDFVHLVGDPRRARLKNSPGFVTRIRDFLS